MNLKAYNINNTTDLGKVKRLYLEAFPKEERLPWWLLRALTIRAGTELTAYYDGDLFCGFTFSAACGKAQLVMFLAVAENLRGGGYGSAILEYLKNVDPERTILLNVELLDPEADNYAQRLRRMAFYQKNGIYDTGYNVVEVGGAFRVLASTQAPDMDAYLRVYHYMSWGFWRPPIEKVQ